VRNQCGFIIKCKDIRSTIFSRLRRKCPHSSDGGRVWRPASPPCTRNRRGPTLNYPVIRARRIHSRIWRLRISFFVLKCTVICVARPQTQKPTRTFFCTRRRMPTLLSRKWWSRFLNLHRTHNSLLTKRSQWRSSRCCQNHQCIDHAMQGWKYK
jgi:hypothetical protein